MSSSRNPQPVDSSAIAKHFSYTSHLGQGLRTLIHSLKEICTDSFFCFHFEIFFFSPPVCLMRLWTFFDRTFYTKSKTILNFRWINFNFSFVLKTKSEKQPKQRRHTTSNYYDSGMAASLQKILLTLTHSQNETQPPGQQEYQLGDNGNPINLFTDLLAIYPLSSVEPSTRNTPTVSMWEKWIRLVLPNNSIGNAQRSCVVTAVVWRILRCPV